MNSFVFVVCQAGAEPVLKSEVAKNHPELRFAYSRPGFVTFKWLGEHSLPPDFRLESVFGRAYAISLGKVKLSSPDFLEQITSWTDLLAPSAKKLRLHVYERDQHKPGEEPLGYEFGNWKKKLYRKVSKLDRFLVEEKARVGDIVLNLVAVEEDEVWGGYFTQEEPHSPFAGGRIPVDYPKEAPSRAYLKLEEALIWSGAPVRTGDTAVEIGSAPGGASYALLKRGLTVIGIDPGEMDPVVLEFIRRGKFQHFKLPVAQVIREDLPKVIDWLLVDMNVTPHVALSSLDRLIVKAGSSLQGVFATVKLSQWKVAKEIPALMDWVKHMGMSKVRATQLPSHKQEILIYGLTRNGIRRPGSV